jgi:bifunctional non-homologous end joining protein LigD
MQRRVAGATAKFSGARKSAFPGFIDYCDPTLREKAPIGAEWVYEIKTDGYRAQVHIRDGQVTVYSRSGYDWTEQFGTKSAPTKVFSPFA